MSTFTVGTLTSQYSYLHTLCSICTLWYFYFSTCSEYFSFTWLFTVTHTSKLSRVGFSDEWSLRIATSWLRPPLDDDTAGGNNVTKQNRSQSESSSVLHGPLQSLFSPGPKLWTRAGSEQTRSGAVRLDLQPQRHADFSSLWTGTGRQQDSVWLGFVRFSSGNTTKKQVSWWLFKL